MLRKKFRSGKKLAIFKPGGAGNLLMEHMPKSTQEVGGCLLRFSKSICYFFVRKIIGFQKIFREGKLMDRNFSEKGGGGGSFGKILKTIRYGAFSCFIRERGLPGKF